MCRPYEAEHEEMVTKQDTKQDWLHAARTHKPQQADGQQNRHPSGGCPTAHPSTTSNPARTHPQVRHGCHGRRQLQQIVGTDGQEDLKEENELSMVGGLLTSFVDCSVPAVLHEDGRPSRMATAADHEPDTPCSMPCSSREQQSTFTAQRSTRRSGLTSWLSGRSASQSSAGIGVAPKFWYRKRIRGLSAQTPAWVGADQRQSGGSACRRPLPLQPAGRLQLK